MRKVGDLVDKGGRFCNNCDSWFRANLPNYYFIWKANQDPYHYYKLFCDGETTYLYECFIYGRPSFTGDVTRALFQTNSIIPLPIINDSITIGDMNKLADRLKKLGAFA